MNNHKRILSLFLAFILALSPFTSVFAQSKKNVEKTGTQAEEVQIGEETYYIFSEDRNAKRDLIRAQEKSAPKTEILKTFGGLEISDNLFGGPIKAAQTTSYTLNIKGSDFKGVGGKTFDWDTLPEGLELQVWYLDEDGFDVNIGNPIVINKSNFQETITRTFDIAGQPIAFGMKTNVDTETYLTDVYLTNENSPEPGVGSLDMTFDLVQVPSTNLSVKWVDVNQQPLARENTPATILKDILTFNFIENRKFDLPNQDKEDPYFRLTHKIGREEIKDMEGATALVDGKKNGEEVTLDGKTYKLTTSYNPALNEGSKIQLMFMPDVIDRTKNPDAETPENYVRVTIDAGEGTKLAEGETRKVYDVRVGKSLKAEHYPKLEVLEGHKEPITWTIAPETAITKAEDILGNAGKTAAETITAENLQPVDTKALQGQNLDEKFWHDGVVLADGVKDNEDFKALLAEAKVTDLSNRSTTKVNSETGKLETEQVGKLLVTFKDGSTLEVENQKLIVKPNTVTVALDKAEGKEHPLRHGDTTVKGTISATSNEEGENGFKVSLDGALVTIKKGDTVLSRTLANADGSFVAGIKDPLVAGEDISVVVTLPESNTESAPVTEKVGLNPDRLNEIIPTGNEVVKNFEGKQGVNQEKVTALKNALKKATDDLVQTDGKVRSTVTVDAAGQKSLDDQYEAIKKAIEALTGNSAPEVTGTSHKEIFKGDALNLEEGIKVTDKDGETDIVKDGGKAFAYTVEKIGEKGAKEAVQDTSKIKDTAGTYEVTYTAKDKSGAEGTFVMTLVVKEPVVEIKDNFPEEIPEGYVKVEFKEGAHGTLEGTTKFLVKEGSAKTALNAPTIKPNANYEAKKDANWEPAIPEKFAEHFETTAQYTYTGEDVVEQKPGDKKPDVPDNFVKVEFKKGEHGIISSEETTIYWVNPEKEVTLTAPTVTPSNGYKHTGWNPEVQANTKYTGAKEFVAQYKATVVTEDPNDAEHYAKVDFAAGDQGKFEQVDGQNQVTTFWVWKGEKVFFNAPKVTANENYKFKEWDEPIQETYDADTTHTATYESTQDVSDTEVAGYNKVTFKAGEHGTLTEKSVWVKPDTLVDLTDKAPEVTPAEGYSHIGWKPDLIGKFADGTEIVAQYSNNISDKPVEGWTELTFDQGDHGKFDKGVKNVKWVNPKAELKLKDIAPAIVADTNYSHDGWKDGETKADLEKAQKFETAKTFTATYKSNVLDKDEYDKIPEDEKKNFVQITFAEGTNGKFPKEAVKEVYVKKDVAVDLTEKAPTVIPNQGYGHSGWEPALKGTFTEASTITAQYKEGTFDEDAIKEIMVVGPIKMGYGEGEKLDLTGLKVIAKDDAGLQKTYEGVDAIKAAGFTIEPDNETVLTKKDHDGQPIKVTKGSVTGQTETTLTIHENRSAKAEDVKALNQNKVVDGKVTNEPKDTTTVTGKVKPGSTVVIKDETGNDITPADGVTVKEDGTFTAEVKKQDEGKKVQVIVTEEGKQPADPAEATVARDANNDGKADSDADQKTATPTAKALNQGEDPKVTTITGKAEKGATVIAKVDGKEVGRATVGENGEYTIKATKTGEENGGALDKDTEVKVTAQEEGKLESEPATTTVKIDKDGNGVADNEENFDIKKVTKVEVLQDPTKMDYLVGSKTAKAPFHTSGLVVKLTDSTGKEVKYTADELKGMDGIKIEPADGDEIGLDKNGTKLKVTVTGSEQAEKPTAESKGNITVKVDADGNGIADEDEKTPEPEVYARNIGENPDKTTVEVETEKNADVTIEYKDKETGKTKKIEAKADDQGKLTKEIQPKLDKDTEVKVIVKDGEKQPTEKVVKVFDDVDDNKIPDTQAGQTERPAALASNIGKEPKFTTITGEAEKGATVTAKVGSEVVGTATADKETGKYTIEAKQNDAPIKQGVKVDVTAILKPKTESFKQTVVVFNDSDGTGQPDSAKDFNVKKAKEMQVISSPEKMVYNDGDQLNLDGLKVLITDVNGNQKIFTYNSENNTEFTNAGLTVDYKQGVKLTNDDNGKKLTVTLDTKENTEVTEAITGETPTALTVNKNQSAQPTDIVAANQGDAKVTKVKGKAVKGAEVKITDESGNSLLPEGTTLKAGDNGEFEADLNKLLDPGTKVFVTATEPGKTESPKAETTVIRDKDGDWKADTGAKLSTPVIDPIREKDEKVVVEAPKADDKIKTIEVSDQNGNTVTLTKDASGNTWTVVGSDPAEKVTEQGGKIEIPVKDKLPLNDRDQIKVTFKDGENPANEAFDKAPVQKASQTPKVDPVYTGDKSVKIADPTVADPTAKTIKVKVNDNDSMTVEKQPDGTWKVKEDPNKEVKVEDGKVVVPLDPSAKKDEVIKVSTINDSGKASPAAEVKVVDKEKSTTPKVNPVATNDTKITGKAGPNADVVITITPKDGGTPKEIVAKADKDGNFSVPVDGLKDGDTIVAKATEKDKAPTTSDTVTVGVDTSALDKAITDGKGELEKRKDGTPADKALEDAIKEGEDLKKRDPAPSQEEVDKAKDKIEKAIEDKKKADEARDKLKEIIKEAEEETQKDGYKDKPGKDRRELEKTIKEGKESLENNTKIPESTEKIKDALEKIRKETLKVGLKDTKVGYQSITITTFPSYCKVKIFIDDVYIEEIETDGFGSYRYTLDEPVKSGTTIELKAHKDGFNDSSYWTKVK